MDRTHSPFKAISRLTMVMTMMLLVFLSPLTCNACHGRQYQISHISSQGTMDGFHRGASSTGTVMPSFNQQRVNEDDSEGDDKTNDDVPNLQRLVPLSYIRRQSKGTIQNASHIPYQPQSVPAGFVENKQSVPPIGPIVSAVLPSVMGLLSKSNSKSTQNTQHQDEANNAFYQMKMERLEDSLRRTMETVHNNEVEMKKDLTNTGTDVLKSLTNNVENKIMPTFKTMVSDGKDEVKEFINEEIPAKVQKTVKKSVEKFLDEITERSKQDRDQLQKEFNSMMNTISRDKNAFDVKTDKAINWIDSKIPEFVEKQINDKMPSKQKVLNRIVPTVEKLVMDDVDDKIQNFKATLKTIR